MTQIITTIIFSVTVPSKLWKYSYPRNQLDYDRQNIQKISSKFRFEFGLPTIFNEINIV